MESSSVVSTCTAFVDMVQGLRHGHILAAGSRLRLHLHTVYQWEESAPRLAPYWSIPPDARGSVMHEQSLPRATQGSTASVNLRNDDCDDMNTVKSLPKKPIVPILLTLQYASLL